jgi:hypothetical protein
MCVCVCVRVCVCVCVSVCVCVGGGGRGGHVHWFVVRVKSKHRRATNKVAQERAESGCLHGRVDGVAKRVHRSKHLQSFLEPAPPTPAERTTEQSEAAVPMERKTATENALLVDVKQTI